MRMKCRLDVVHRLHDDVMLATRQHGLGGHGNKQSACLLALWSRMQTPAAGILAATKLAMSACKGPFATWQFGQDMANLAGLYLDSFSDSSAELPMLQIIFGLGISGGRPFVAHVAQDSQPDMIQVPRRPGRNASRHR